MKHALSIEGYGYKLRPVQLEDAGFIIEVRLEDKERNRFIHEISDDVSLQEKWIREYWEREGDYYFVIENKISGQREGLIALYDMQSGKAEWGRWVIKKGSMAAVESVDLIYKAAFDKLGLDELYCRTIEDNTAVVSFHDAAGEKKRAVLKDFFTVNQRQYNAVEHYVDREYYYQNLQEELEKKAYMVFLRNLKMAVGKFEFHHIGVATKEIKSEIGVYKLLGYVREGRIFEDEQQGIRGQFMISKNQPRIELLENLPESHTLDLQLEKRNHLYHFAYMVADIEKAVEILLRCHARIVSPMKTSVYFEKRICFLVLKNMFMIELVEL